MNAIGERLGSNWSIVGHAWAVDMLRQHVKRGTARHAYLITGPRGIGRRTLALRFAQALNCESLSVSGDACGQCYHCQHYEVDLQRLASGGDEDSGNGHPDLRYVEPVTLDELKQKEAKKSSPGLTDKESDGSAGRGARSIRIEQIREEREKIPLKPYIGRFRVVLFSRFEEATTEASNALLKTLEEAPAHAVLMITASDAESLLPTIVSRCEVLRLQRVPAPDIEALLLDRGVEAALARIMARVSDGSPGVALRLAADEDLRARRKGTLEDLLSLLRATRARRFAYASRLSGDRHEMRDVLLTWLSFWRDVLWRAAGAASPIANIDFEPAIQAVAERLSLPEAHRIVEDLDAGLRKLDSSINARLLAEVLLLDWPHALARE